jgi:hypothetical protein
MLWRPGDRDGADVDGERRAERLESLADHRAVSDGWAGLATPRKTAVNGRSTDRRPPAPLGVGCGGATTHYLQLWHPAARWVWSGGIGPLNRAILRLQVVT